MSKFKVGDKVVGNDSADEKYGVTKKGWVGTVKCCHDDGCIAVESLDREHIYPAHEDYFDKFDSTQKKIVITEEDQFIRVEVFEGEKFLYEGTEIGDGFIEEARKLLENCRPKIPELKDGYILEIMYEGKKSLAGVYHNAEGELCISGENYWAPVDEFGAFGERDKGTFITRVFGRACGNKFAHDISTMGRNLIWERK